MLAFQGLFLNLFPESRHQEIWSGVVIEYETGQIQFKYQGQFRTNIYTWTRADSTWVHMISVLKVSATATLGCRIPDQEVLDKASFVQFTYNWVSALKFFQVNTIVFFSMLHSSFLLLIGGKHRKKWHYTWTRLFLFKVASFHDAATQDLPVSPLYSRHLR